MKRIGAIAISLFLMIGLTTEAQAVTSGVYKCVAFQGPTDDLTTLVVPAVLHYNPNATGVQSITRVRIFDSFGTLIFDQPSPPGTFTVNGRGSTIVFSAQNGFPEGLQFIVNWSQGADALAPIARLTLLLFDTGIGAYVSVSQSSCP